MSEGNSLQDLLSRKWNMGMTFRAFLDYSQKNVDKMKNVYQQTGIDPTVAEELKGLSREIRMLALGADWCGDAVANLPPIARLAELNSRLQLRIVDRDRHDDLMEQFLTNGAKSIPKVIVANGNMERFVTWGARPAACQAIMDQNKGKMPKEEIIPMIRDWYEKDKGRTVLFEIWGAISQFK